MNRSVKLARDRRRQCQTMKNTAKVTKTSYLTRDSCQPVESKRQWVHQGMLQPTIVLSQEQSKTLWKASWSELPKPLRQCEEVVGLVLIFLGYALAVTGLLVLIVPLVALLVSWAFLMQYVKQ